MKDYQNRYSLHAKGFHESDTVNHKLNNTAAFNNNSPIQVHIIGEDTPLLYHWRGKL